MTIGDILAVIAAILAIAATWAATIIACALLFQARSQQARDRLAAAPGRIFLRGLMFTAVALIVAGIVNSSHSGPTRILAGAILSALLLASALGGSGIVRLIAARINAADDTVNSFANLGRATGLYVAAGFLPVVGWFVLAPLALVFSVGAATAALFPVVRSTGPTAASASLLGTAPDPLP
jgi:hypothetical protein